MSDTKEVSDLTQSDIATRPTVFILLDEHGDVVFSANNPSIDLPMAISMCELAKQKMIATYYQTVMNEKKRAELTKPHILIPR